MLMHATLFLVYVEENTSDIQICDIKEVDKLQ
jgi:hypothetical protein